MKKFKWSFIAVALIAVCSAFATKKATYDFTYEYVDRIGNEYVVGLDVTGETPGGSVYDCGLGSICTISSDQEPDGNNRVDVIDEESQEHPGDFQLSN